MKDILTGEVRNSENGYITELPTQVSKDLNINDGDELEFIKEADGSYNMRKKKMNLK